MPWSAFRIISPITLITPQTSAGLVLPKITISPYIRRVKIVIVALLMVVGFSLHAQDSVSADEWKRQNDESYHLAILLFPDFQKPESMLSKEYKLCLPDPDLYPRLSRDSVLPLATVFHAATFLGIQPAWGVLKDSEKLEAIEQINYFSVLLVQTIRDQNKLIASYQAARPNTFTPQGIVPEALSPSAREAFYPSQSQGTAPYRPTQGNGAPPVPIPTPPLTSTIIDAQTGETQIIVH